MDKLLDNLHYGGLTKEEYYRIVPSVREENRKNLFVFSAIAAISFSAALAIRLVYSFGIAKKLILVLIVVYALMSLIAGVFLKKNNRYSNLFAYLFTILLLGVGIFAGISQPKERTTLLLPFFAFSAVLFCYKIIVYLLIMAVAEGIFLWQIAVTQTGTTMLANRANSLIFCFTGMIAGVYIMRMKYKKHQTDYMNDFLLSKDALTGLYNRRRFDMELERVKAEQVPVAICVFDVNELKPVNDTLGHGAGDELICGAADCIAQTFDPYGKIFRTGGDEFVAIVDSDLEDMERLLQKLRETLANWSGKKVKYLALSCGYAIVENDFETQVVEALKEADRLMYEDKRKYYESRGIERRKH